MIEFNVGKRWSKEIAFTAEIDCSESATRSWKLRLAVLWAIKHKINMSGADMSGANMRGADMSGADMRYANMSYADMRYANMRYADMRGANMSGANMSGADMSGANMRGADMIGADMRGANMSGAENAIIPVTIGQVGGEIRTGYAIWTPEGIMVKLGCFYDTEKEAIKAVSDKYGVKSGYTLMVKAACQVAKERGILNPREEIK